ncbi:hypothetical protein J3F83DRAFT_744272 [Trichoderma novae-zelandiae]
MPDPGRPIATSRDLVLSSADPARIDDAVCRPGDAGCTRNGRAGGRGWIQALFHVGCAYFRLRSTTTVGNRYVTEPNERLRNCKSARHLFAMVCYGLKDDLGRWRKQCHGALFLRGACTQPRPHCPHPRGSVGRYISIYEQETHPQQERHTTNPQASSSQRPPRKKREKTRKEEREKPNYPFSSLPLGPPRQSNVKNARQRPPAILVRSRQQQLVQPPLRPTISTREPPPGKSTPCPSFFSFRLMAIIYLGG